MCVWEREVDIRVSLAGGGLVYSRLATRYWRPDSTAPPQRVRAQLSHLLLLLIATLLGFVPRRQQPNSAFLISSDSQSGTEIYLFFNQRVCLCRVGVIATPMYV